MPTDFHWLLSDYFVGFGIGVFMFVCLFLCFLANVRIPFVFAMEKNPLIFGVQGITQLHGTHLNVVWIFECRVLSLSGLCAHLPHCRLSLSMFHEAG